MSQTTTPVAPAPATAPFTTTSYVDVADTAKLLRADLRAAFPKTKFTVRSERYSGGASISVRWTDGPTSAAVDAVADGYRGKHMVDLTDYSAPRYGALNGQRVRFGSDYVLLTRLYSLEFAQQVADEVADRCGVAPITVREIAGSADWSHAWAIKTDNYQGNLADAIYRTISRRTAL